VTTSVRFAAVTEWVCYLSPLKKDPRGFSIAVCYVHLNGYVRRVIVLLFFWAWRYFWPWQESPLRLQREWVSSPTKKRHKRLSREVYSGSNESRLLAAVGLSPKKKRPQRLFYSSPLHQTMVPIVFALFTYFFGSIYGVYTLYHNLAFHRPGLSIGLIVA
jgi:hypothetical protein